MDNFFNVENSSPSNQPPSTPNFPEPNNNNKNSNNLETLYDEGFSVVEKAQQAEKDQNFSLSLSYYIEASEIFMKAGKINQSERSSRLIRKKISEFLKKADELKDIIQKTSSSSSPSPSPSPSLILPSVPSFIPDNNQKFPFNKSSSDDPNIKELETLLNSALNLDEKSQIEKALPFYLSFSKQCLSILSSGRISSLEKNQMRRRLSLVLNRIETIKGIQLPKTQSDTTFHTSSPSHSHSSSNIDEKISSDTKRLTTQEIMLLKETSDINNHRFLPFLNDELTENFHFSSLFSDPDGFLPLNQSQKKRDAHYKRVSQLFSKPCVIYTISPFPITQTCIGDCSFISGLAVAANYERNFKHQIISNKIFPQNSNGQPIYNPCGKYMVKLHLNGIDRKVIIDDYLPVDHSQNLLCSYSNNKGELWISLFEKAFLKVFGGYGFYGSNSSVDLHIISSWIPQRISFSNQVVLKENLSTIYRGIKNGFCLLTVSTKDLSNHDSENYGLVPSHAYAVLRMEYVNDLILFQLKNPWSNHRWKGPYSPGHPTFTSEIQNKLHDTSTQASIDNGIFWIDFSSLLQFFQSFYLSWDHSLFPYHTTLHYKWPMTSGPKIDRIKVTANPQFFLEINQSQINGGIWILLSRHITEHKEYESDFTTIHIVEAVQPCRLHYFPSEFVHEGEYINSPHYLIKLSSQICQKHHSFIILLSQYQKTRDLHFSLSVYSSMKIKTYSIVNPYISEHKIEGLWQTDSSGGSSNNLESYLKNPQYILSLDHRMNILIELMAPKEYHINLRMLRSKDPLHSGNMFSRSILDSGSYRGGYCIIETLLDIGDYMIIPSTFQPHQFGKYFLLLHSDQPRQAFHLFQNK